MYSISGTLFSFSCAPNAVQTSSRGAVSSLRTVPEPSRAPSPPPRTLGCSLTRARHVPEPNHACCSEPGRLPWIASTSKRRRRVGLCLVSGARHLAPAPCPSRVHLRASCTTSARGSPLVLSHVCVVLAYGTESRRAASGVRA